MISFHPEYTVLCVSHAHLSLLQTYHREKRLNFITPFTVFLGLKNWIRYMWNVTSISNAVFLIRSDSNWYLIRRMWNSTSKTSLNQPLVYSCLWLFMIFCLHVDEYTFSVFSENSNNIGVISYVFRMFVSCGYYVRKRHGDWCIKNNIANFLSSVRICNHISANQSIHGSVRSGHMFFSLRAFWPSFA